MRKKFSLLLPFLLFSCGGGGGGSVSVESNNVPQQVAQVRTVPVKVNLVFPEGVDITRTAPADGTYKVVFLVNGLDISTSPQVFDNLSPGQHSFTVNVPVGGKRFMTVLISKFDNGGVEYPLYYGDTSFDMNEGETTSLNIVMNLSFYRSGGNNYYPGVEKKKILGDLSTEVADVNLRGRYFADPGHTLSNEYSNNGKLPIKSYSVHDALRSVSGTPSSGWSSQTVYNYTTSSIPSTLYRFYSYFYDSGIPTIYSGSYSLTPFGLDNGFSWNLIPGEGYYKIVGINYNTDTSQFELQECQVTYDESSGWSSLQNCQTSSTKNFTPSLTGKKPSGEIYFLYKSGTAGSDDVFLPYPIFLFSIPDTLTVPSNVKYAVEHFHSVSFPQDRVEEDVAVKIDVSSTSEGSVTVSTTSQTYTVPSNQYYVELFSRAQFKTPFDYYLIGENSYGLKLNVDEWMNFEKLSFVRIYSPEGKTSSTSADLSTPSGETTRKYAIVLTSGGNFHLIDISNTNSVNLRDISISGSNDSIGRFLFTLSGNDAGDISSCSITFNMGYVSDATPSYIHYLFEPGALKPVYVFNDLPKDRLFVKVEDTSSVNSVMVECKNESGDYKVIKFFHMEDPIQAAFDYASTFSQSETLSFDGSSAFITAHYTSSISSNEAILVFSKIGDEYAEYDYYLPTESQSIVTYEYLKDFLDHMGEEGETEAQFTFYVTNYKGGTYRKGVLSFQQAEDGETVTLNPDGTADLSWNTSNFNQCTSDLNLLVTYEPSTTDNDGEENVSTSADSTVYIYKICPSSTGATLYYKRFDIAQPAQTTGSGSNGELDTDTNIPDTSTPG